MKIYLVRFARISESMRERETEKNVQLKRTSKFFKNKDIQKIYIKNDKRAGKTAKGIIEQLGNPIEEKISEKEDKEEISKIFGKIKNERHERVIIISNSNFITQFLLSALGLPFEEKKYFRVKNCSISNIELDEDNEVKSFDVNDCSHLLNIHYFNKN